MTNYQEDFGFDYDMQEISAEEMYGSMSNAELEAMTTAIGTTTEKVFTKSDNVASSSLPDVIPMTEYKFSPARFGEFLNAVSVRLTRLDRMEQARVITETREYNHEQKIQAKRTGTEFTPKQVPTMVKTKLDDLYGCESLLESAILYVFRNAFRKELVLLTNTYANVTARIRFHTQCVKVAQAAQKEDASITITAFLDNHRAALVQARAEFKSLINTIMPKDALLVKPHLTEKLQFTSIHTARKAVKNVLMDEGDDLLNSKETGTQFLSKHVLKEREDSNMFLVGEGSALEGIPQGVLNRVNQAFNPTPNYSATSKAERVDESIYRETNDVTILSDTTQVLIGDLAQRFGLALEQENPALRIEDKLTPAQHAIGYVEGVIAALEDDRLFGSWDDNGYAIDNPELDDERYEAIMLAKKELAAFTEPQRYGNSYVLGSGGARKVYNATT